MDHRTSVANSDYWKYAYDNKNELTSAKHYNSGNNPLKEVD
jgi:hypothetical protein